jgi:hypothetical protein
MGDEGLTKYTIEWLATHGVATGFRDEAIGRCIDHFTSGGMEGGRAGIGARADRFDAEQRIRAEARAEVATTLIADSLQNPEDAVNILVRDKKKVTPQRVHRTCGMLLIAGRLIDLALHNGWISEEQHSECLLHHEQLKVKIGKFKKTPVTTAASAAAASPRRLNASPAKQLGFRRAGVHAAPSRKSKSGKPKRKSDAIVHDSDEDNAATNPKPKPSRSQKDGTCLTTPSLAAGASKDGSGSPPLSPPLSPAAASPPASPLLPEAQAQPAAASSAAASSAASEPAAKRRKGVDGIPVVNGSSGSSDEDETASD